MGTMNNTKCNFYIKQTMNYKERLKCLLKGELKDAWRGYKYVKLENWEGTQWIG